MDRLDWYLVGERCVSVALRGNRAAVRHRGDRVSAAPKFTPDTGSRETSTRHSTQSEVEPALVAREKDRSGQQFTPGPWEVSRVKPYVSQVGGGTVARAYAGGR